MKKVIALMSLILLLLTIGCSSGIQQQQPIANNNVQPQKQTNMPEKSKNDEDEKLLEKAKIKPLKYKQSQARSNQKTIAVFTIGENHYRIGDTSFKMNGPAVIRNNFINADTIFVPLQAFNKIVSIPDSGIEWTEYVSWPHTLYKIELKKENLSLVADGYDTKIKINEKEVVLNWGPAGLIDHSGIKYINLVSFSRAFNMDVYWEYETGKVELLEEIPFNNDDLMIGPVKWGMTAQQVREVLGQPGTVIGPRHAVGSLRDNEIVLNYKGLEINAVGRTGDQWSWPIWEITCDSSEYQTKRGIRIGDQFDRVVELYGMGYTYRGWFSDEYRYSSPTNKGEHYSLRFVVEDNKVKKIMVGQGPPVEP